ncbi:hypothetical protein [Hymenobacter sp. YC55]|uniref:hypothetical protein n=1 Tax=Hymenobacter sp. YC55 TaxID=3034019 RepID=UPI0023F94025|nr:hypothetical protein [Hymenobacter sp. YC55]MDF7815285.1 hypothetical protein [Hymenobacter sp. YC55]
MKGFRFKGFTFRPFRQLTAEEKRTSGQNSAWRRVRTQETAPQTTPEPALEPVLKDKESGWDYRAFYQAAKQAGASKIDLFMVAGRGSQLFLPVQNNLLALPELA